MDYCKVRFINLNFFIRDFVISATFPLTRASERVQDKSRKEIHQL